MAIPSRQIGWSTTDNLLWEINSNVDNAIIITSAVATGNIPAIPGLIVTVNQVG
jgi:hypothetical protein